MKELISLTPFNDSVNVCGKNIVNKHSQLSRTRLIGTLAYQEIDEKIDVNRKSSGISGVWRTSTVCNR